MRNHPHQPIRSTHLQLLQHAELLLRERLLALEVALGRLGVQLQPHPPDLGVIDAEGLDQGEQRRLSCGWGD